MAVSLCTTTSTYTTDTSLPFSTTFATWPTWPPTLPSHFQPTHVPPPRSKPTFPVAYSFSTPEPVTMPISSPPPATVPHPTPVAFTPSPNQPTQLTTTLAWDSQQGVWQQHTFSVFPPVVQPDQSTAADKDPPPSEPSTPAAASTPTAALPTLPALASPNSTGPPALPSQPSTEAITDTTKPPPSTPAGSVRSDAADTTHPTDPPPSHPTPRRHHRRRRHGRRRRRHHHRRGRSRGHTAQRTPRSAHTHTSSRRHHSSSYTYSSTSRSPSPSRSRSNSAISLIPNTDSLQQDSTSGNPQTTYPTHPSVAPCSQQMASSASVQPKNSTGTARNLDGLSCSTI